MATYKKHVEYHFECDDEHWAISPPDKWGRLTISELRNNGQEDTHMTGDIEKSGNGEWVWSNDDNTIFEYGGNETAGKLLGFINSNPLPFKLG